MKRTLLASLGILVFVSAGWLASTGYGSANHFWGNYHWARKTNPFTLRVIDSTTGTVGSSIATSTGWDKYRLQAQADWAVSDVLDLTNAGSDGSSSARQRCAAATGRVRVCNSTYGQNGWLGIATIWINGDHITAGTVKNNDTYFNMAAYNTPAWRQFVICQEIGHTFGLAHQDENFGNANLGSCMDYTNDPDGGPGGVSATDPDNQHPNAHDYDLLTQLYGHSDSFNSYTASPTSTPAAAPALAGQRAPEDRGPMNVDGDDEDALPAGAHAGMGHHFTRQRADGTRVESFVLWADEVPSDPTPRRPRR